MKSIDRNNRRFVDDILERNKDVVPFIFEDYNIGLPHREFIIVAFSLLKQRPWNKVLIKILWDYIRNTDKPVPDYVVEFTQERFMKWVFEPRNTEATQVANSIANSSVFNKGYKGYIYAVDIETDKITPLVSATQMKELGFTPSRIYECLFGNSYTHKGHVFVLDKEESHGHVERAIRQGSSRLLTTANKANHRESP